MRALITGISGQDGSYLAEYLLSKGYEVFGLVRRNALTIPSLSSAQNFLELLYGDLRDSESLDVALKKAWPDELYNLGGQTFVPTSWEYPAETYDINVGGLARLLKIVERQKPDTKVYQASSSEMFGNFDGPCNEATPFAPISPYGGSKLAAHNLVQVYRERGLFVVGGILFNHESPRRGAEMVTRKITRAARRWFEGDWTSLRLGNIKSKRDWGFAGDYVKAMHAMLQRDVPTDYVIGTGESHSVEEFLLAVCELLHRYSGMEEFLNPFDNLVEIDKAMVRQNDMHDLHAESRLAEVELNWKPTVRFNSLVKIMVDHELEKQPQLS